MSNLTDTSSLQACNSGTQPIVQISHKVLIQEEPSLFKHHQ